MRSNLGDAAWENGEPAADGDALELFLDVVAATHLSVKCLFWSVKIGLEKLLFRGKRVVVEE